MFICYYFGSIHFRCHGPQSTIGPDGCEACDRFLLSDNGNKIDQCVNTSVITKCPSGYLAVNQHSKLEKPVQDIVSAEGFKDVSLSIAIYILSRVPH